MKIKVEIQRFNPETDAEPYIKTYEVEADPTDRLLTVLMTIKSNQDPGLGIRRISAVNRGQETVRGGHKMHPLRILLFRLSRHPRG